MLISGMMSYLLRVRGFPFLAPPMAVPRRGALFRPPLNVACVSSSHRKSPDTGLAPLLSPLAAISLTFRPHCQLPSRLRNTDVAAVPPSTLQHEDKNEEKLPEGTDIAEGERYLRCLHLSLVPAPALCMVLSVLLQ